MDPVSRYFSKYFKIFLAGFLLCIVIGGGAGYLVSKPSVHIKNVDSTSEKFATVVREIDQSNYRKFMEIFRPMDDEQFKTSLSKHGIVVEGLEWESTPPVLFGDIFLAGLVNEASEQYKRVDIASNRQQVQTQFPDIAFIGITMNKAGNRCVTTMNVSGRPDVWLWTKNGSEWKTASLPGGFGLRSASIGKDTVVFVLFSLQNTGDTKEYSFQAGGSVPLEQFKTRM